MPVELHALPQCLEAGCVGDNFTAGSGRIPLMVARDWAQEVELLATSRHPNIGTLLGITLLPSEPGVERGAALALVYEASRDSRLLFEWIHATLPDGSRRPLGFRLELQISIGLCEALKFLAEKNLACGALCSVNVELVQVGSEMTARIARIGTSWWRWGWRASLSTREAGQPKRKALSMQDVISKYGTCPVNWLAPELLRGKAPNELTDVYSFGLVLWEMLYRAVPFGDFAIAHIVASVGYGRRQVRAAASSGASTGTSFLQEVVNRCANWEPAQRPKSFSMLQESLQEQCRIYDRRKASKNVFGRLLTEADNLLSGGHSPAYASSAAGRTPGQAATAQTDGPRMVRLATGEWVRVDMDLLEQFPDDEDKWRSLMAFRARLNEA